MRVLIAEDDPVSERVLRSTLETNGHTVFSANNGKRAWDLLLREPVQIIVSDWMMPEMDGLELCQKVRNRRRRREYVYFILLTARTGRENYQKAMETGVDDFLAKPLRQEELVTRLRVAERILGFMGQVSDLKRMLPICSYCKKVRDDKDYWHQIETYIHDHTGTDFSHSICPVCYEAHIKPQLESMDTDAESEAPKGEA